MKRFLMIALAVLTVASLAAAQDMMDTPTVEVTDQVVLDNSVRIDRVYSAGPGWVVIHSDDMGAPGAPVGVRGVPAGWTFGLDIAIDPAAATPMLFAMLHVDDGEEGVYEFGTVEGADGPVMGDNGMVSPGFAIELISVANQLDASGSVVIGNVITQQDGWIAIHSDNGEGRPGPVLGHTQISAGNNAGVTVELMGEVTARLFPMTHVDTGEIGVYEFGTVEGADGPVRINGVVAVIGMYQGTPSMVVPNQIVTDTVLATVVVSDGPGWLAIHADNGEGRPGPVIGSAAVEDGTNRNVAVEVDAAGVTPVLFPMLHVDTGEIGVYEFGTVEGADGPVRVNDQVLVFPVQAASSIDYVVERVEREDGTVLVVSGARIDAPGWLAIHADGGGSPGPVIGHVRILPGSNSNIQVGIADPSGITDTVFPMLHYDTGELGVYEFGTVEGADGPVRVGDAVVVGPAEVLVRE